MNHLLTGPLIIRTNNYLSGNNTHVVGLHDQPIPANQLLVTSTGGVLIASDSITLSTINASVINVSTLNYSTIITEGLLDSLSVSLMYISTLSSKQIYSDLFIGSTVQFSTLTGNTIQFSTLIGNTIQTDTLSVRGDTQFASCYADYVGLYPNNNGPVALGSYMGQWSEIYSFNGLIQFADTSAMNYTPLQYGLDEIIKLNTIKYKWKYQDELPDANPTKQFQYFGISTDNLNTILPELIYSMDADSPVHINYSELIPILINSIKQLREIAYQQNEQINEQNEHIKIMTDHITTMKMMHLTDIDNLTTHVESLTQEFNIVSSWFKTIHEQPYVPKKWHERVYRNTNGT